MIILDTWLLTSNYFWRGKRVNEMNDRKNIENKIKTFKRFREVSAVKTIKICHKLQIEYWNKFEADDITESANLKKHPPTKCKRPEI